jgi:hypothetical protein
VKHIRNLIVRYDAWLGSQHAAVEISLNLLLFPGILMLSLVLIHRDSHGRLVTSWAIVYTITNAVALVVMWTLSWATTKRRIAEREALYQERLDLEKDRAGSESRRLRYIIRLRKEAELLPPDRRADALAKLDAIAARLGAS